MDCSYVHIGTTAADAAGFLNCISPAEPWYKVVLALLTPALVASSALIAFFALRNTRLLARQKATLDLIEKTESTELYRENSSVFSQRRKASTLHLLADPQTDEDKNHRRCVMDFLNHYELVSIGVDRGILDAKIYQKWMLSTFIRDWNAAADLVQSERWRLSDDGSDWIYHSAIFAEYGELACKWSKEARRLTRGEKPPSPSGKIGKAIAPGDDPLPQTGAVDNGPAGHDAGNG